MECKTVKLALKKRRCFAFSDGAGKVDIAGLFAHIGEMRGMLLCLR